MIYDLLLSLPAMLGPVSFLLQGIEFLLQVPDLHRVLLTVKVALQGSHHSHTGHELKVVVLHLRKGTLPQLNNGLHIFGNDPGYHRLHGQGTGARPQE